MGFLLTEAEIDVRMREEFSKVCFETCIMWPTMYCITHHISVEMYQDGTDRCLM